MIPADSMARPRQNVQRTTLHSSTWSARRGLSTRTNRDGRARGGLGEEQARPCRTANSTHSHQRLHVGSHQWRPTQRHTALHGRIVDRSSQREKRTGYGLGAGALGVTEMGPADGRRWDTFPTAQWTHTGPLDDSQARLTWVNRGAVITEAHDPAYIGAPTHTNDTGELTAMYCALERAWLAKQRAPGGLGDRAGVG